MLVAASSAGCSPKALESGDVAQLAARAGAAVWRVEADGCGWKSRGSAFAIDARHLVTNHHVVANDSAPVIRSRKGTELKGRVIGSAAQPDLAVIAVDEDLPVNLPLAQSSTLGPREPLVVLGYPAPKHAFTASSGNIVSFQGTDAEPREAALTNVPITFGNSGGPGLRADATVAGVVTLMRLRNDASERVAIMFTSDTIRPTVRRFLGKPTDVLSTCGLGPDYVPRVPKSYGVIQAPPTATPLPKLPAVVTPGPAPVTKAPATSRPTAPPTPRRTRDPDLGPTPPPCPSGTVDTSVDEVTATENPEQPGWWKVSVKGTVTNNTTGGVRIDAIYVHVDGDPPVNVRVAPDETVLAPDQPSSWTQPEFDVHAPDGQPTQATTFASWHWFDAEYQNCPSD
jgi:S1-C subfamily serine protease